MAEAKKEKAKVKRPTALKRDDQNAKKREQNKQFKSQTRTAVRRLEESIAAGNKEQIEQRLQDVFSFVDKGVNRGVFKLNKASREKSRLTARARAVRT